MATRMEEESAKREVEGDGGGGGPEERGGRPRMKVLQEQEEAGGDGMTIEAVLQNDEAWDDVKCGWLDREKVREARMEEEGYTKEKVALGRSVKERRVGAQGRFGQVGAHQQGHRE